MDKLTLAKKYNSYPKYKDSGVEWLDKIPSSWCLIPIKALFRRIKRTQYPNETLLSVYRDWGVIDKSSRDDNFNKPSEDLSPYQLVLPGDLVTNKMKTWQGSIAVSNLRGIVSPAYYVMEPLSKLNGRYYHYLLRSDRYIAHYENISTGIRVNQWDLDYLQFKNSTILIPDEAEQERITEYLDVKTALIESVIDKKKKQIELLRETRSALINHSVSKNVHTEEWMSEKLKYLAPQRNTKAGAGQMGGRYIGLENIESGTGRFIETEEKVEVESVVNVFRHSDVLFGKLRPYLAKVFLPEFDGVCTGELLDLVPDTKKIFPKYLFYKLICKDFITAVSDSTYGAKMPRADWNSIGNLSISYPSKEKQVKIVELLDSKTTVIDVTIAQVEKSIGMFDEFKSSLISHVVTGKIKI